MSSCVFPGDPRSDYASCGAVPRTVFRRRDISCLRGGGVTFGKSTTRSRRTVIGVPFERVVCVTSSRDVRPRTRTLRPPVPRSSRRFRDFPNKFSKSKLYTVAFSCTTLSALTFASRSIMITGHSWILVVCALISYCCEYWNDKTHRPTVHQNKHETRVPSSYTLYTVAARWSLNENCSETKPWRKSLSIKYKNHSWSSYYNRGGRTKAAYHTKANVCKVDN